MSNLVLPAFSLFGPDNDPPHRQETIAECTITNEYGVQRRVTLVTNHPGTRWWVFAVYVTGWARASGTLSTGSRTKAEAWEAAIRAGRVRIEPA
jgi:hypothetical protein